ncbi:hypothetical protein HMJ29_12275 [Hymenobacter taeanensis]|uniref:Lipoprotein n=1 Tax=Hymenobacter taeanensis TaxID=2735321 RepID=A0A6M6BHV3_9BACT|nr:MULTISPECIES: hypothetical protein [Hymenobacter]QJX47676.1 hypothetical protein HMJ29_12275 [Hymenobacter taeanensis]UOQ82841.1 hypothetical protein MUN83_08800 [Hymenobacter sp. 5414T-23]
MQILSRLLPMLLAGVALSSGCNSAPSSEQSAAAPAASPVATQPASAAPTDTTSISAQLQNPRVGDVYVVQFQPRNTTEQRYYFYQVFAVRPNEVDLYPARQEAKDPQADTSAPRFFANEASNAMTYTRAEARELLQEQPGDVLHSRLVAVRRP